MKDFLRPLLLVLLLVPSILLPAQDGEAAAIRCMTGAEDEEHLDAQEAERLQHYLRHPLEINLSSRSRLMESGLFSPYQVATLLDYRAANGAILSFTELAAVDGFGEEAVRQLRPFLSLASRSLPGSLPSGRAALTGETLLRAGGGTPGWQYGVKHSLSGGARWAAFLAARTTYADAAPAPPSAWVGNVTLYGHRYPGKLILGDFHTRFGQGACLWSGFSLSGFSTPASFLRRPSGLSPLHSFSAEGAHRGMAADYAFGRFVLSGFVSFPGMLSPGGNTPVHCLPGGSLSWLGKRGQCSLTGSGAGTAALDGRYALRGADLSGEAAVDVRRHLWSGSFGLGVPVGRCRLSALCRYVPPDFGSEWGKAVRVWNRKYGEAGCATGFSYKGCTATLDYARKLADPQDRQWKVYFSYPLQIADSLVLTFRLTERLRPDALLRWRTGARLDADCRLSGWSVRLRTEGLLCRSLGLLAYLDAGRQTGRLSCFARGTLFRIDHWDDRIYSYERDASGAFTVPAYYGRGFSLNAYVAYGIRPRHRLCRSLKLYARAALVRYPWMAQPKTARTEVKGQAVWSF